MSNAGTVTMKDIAQEASVSVAAVSLALSDSPEISDQTKERIRGVGRRLGYVARGRRATPAKGSGGQFDGHSGGTVPQAKAGVRTPQKRLGYLLVGRGRGEDSLSPLLNTLMGLTARYGFRLEVSYLPDTSDPRSFAREATAFAQGLDGLMLAGIVNEAMLRALPTQVEHLAVLGNVMAEAFPIEPGRMVYAVGPNYRQMGQLATQRLLRRGHRRIGIIGEHIYPNLFLAGLIAGYQQTLLEAGVPMDKDWVAVSDKPRSGGQFAARRWAQVDDRPTAFILPDARICSTFLREAELLGWPIGPSDAVLASLNIESSRLAGLHMPTVTPDVETFAHMTLQHLMTPPMAPTLQGLVEVLIPCRTLHFD